MPYGSTPVLASHCCVGLRPMMMATLHLVMPAS